MPFAYLALGSNLGDRPAHLRRSIMEISRLPATRVLQTSRFYGSEPWKMGSGTPYFLNACAKLETQLSPRELLQALQGIERRMGGGPKRGKSGQYLDRAIDLDLVLYGDSQISDPGPPPLVLPHPGLAQRRFVLAPLLEIQPGLRDPSTGKSLARLLEECPDRSRVWALP